MGHNMKISTDVKVSKTEIDNLFNLVKSCYTTVYPTSAEQETAGKETYDKFSVLLTTYMDNAVYVGKHLGKHTAKASWSMKNKANMLLNPQKVV